MTNDEQLQIQVSIQQEHLRSELKRILKIFLTAQESLAVLEYLTSNFDDIDKRVVVYRNVFFTAVRDAMFDQVILELAKLLIPSEYFSLNKFINKFHNRNKYGLLGVESDMIKVWKQNLKLATATIEQIKTVRNSTVAHEDQVEVEDSLITKAELRNLLITIQNIFRDVYSAVFKSEYRIEEPINRPKDNLDFLVNELVRQKKNDLAPLLELAKKHGLDELGNDLS